MGPISVLRELGAYEALWTGPRTSFRSLAGQLRQKPGAVFSDFVPEDEALGHAAEAQRILRAAGIEKFGVSIHGMPDYPERLRNAEHPVELIYYQGAWDLLDSPGVAVIGTREPSEEGAARARELAKRLVEEGFTIVSGLARGIDTAAHESAIHSGRTIAVLGTPLNRRYPPENHALQAEIARDHLVISQVPVVRYQRARNAAANSFFFIERNITMAALTRATVIVEAGERSGTFVQARSALKMGRKVFVLDCNFEDPALRWPAALEKSGAVRLRDYADIKRRLR